MMKNQKVIIVGGSSGIGFAVAQKLFVAGAEVVIAGRSEDKIECAVAQLQGRASGTVLDASNEIAVIDFSHVLVSSIILWSRLNLNCQRVRF